ncbi:TPA: hypothetical protein OB783_005093, partial [Escherichia coli]|nr:hypothetical protein [Escherichia coli]HCO8305794.1 hypothetical protein [Escherichia coli]HCO8314893.1 hypothetical protein [Escherichia coli]HCO8414654.1 hypothetical protein [Escherichia coli]
LFTALGAASGYFIPGFSVTATDTTNRVTRQRSDVGLIRFFHRNAWHISIPAILHLGSKVSVARVKFQAIHIPQNMHFFNLAPIFRYRDFFSARTYVPPFFRFLSNKKAAHGGPVCFASYRFN